MLVLISSREPLLGECSKQQFGLDPVFTQTNYNWTCPCFTPTNNNMNPFCAIIHIMLMHV